LHHKHIETAVSVQVSQAHPRAGTGTSDVESFHKDSGLGENRSKKYRRKQQQI
jgi:hypothetical protein